MIFKKDSNLQISWFFHLNKQKIQSQSKSQIPHDTNKMWIGSKHKGNYFYIFYSDFWIPFWVQWIIILLANKQVPGKTKKKTNLGLRIYLETHRPKIVFSVASAPRLYTQREREKEKERRACGTWHPLKIPYFHFPVVSLLIIISYFLFLSLSLSLTQHSLSLTRFPHCPLKPNSEEKQTNKHTHKYLSLSLSFICHSTGLMRSSKRSSSRVCIIIIITLIISSPTTTKTTTAIAEQKPKPKLF